MTLELTIQQPDDAHGLPGQAEVERWIDVAATQVESRAGEVTVRFVDIAEMRELNSRYRGKDQPTNVLSFEFDAPAELPVNILGDIVVCGDVVLDEAARFEMLPDARFAHMIVHGFLHLNGHDHVDPADAARMERCESRALIALGFLDPWLEEGAVGLHDQKTGVAS